MTARPDPALDLVGYLRWLGDRIEQFQSSMDNVKLGAATAAVALGYKRGYFHGKPWRIPGFGQGGYMHTLQVWRDWDHRPEADRRAEWDAKNPVDRRKARVTA